MVFTPVDFSNLFITIDGITRIVDLPPRNAGQVAATEANYALNSDGKRTGPWTEDEQKQFIGVVVEYPRGPWKCIVSRIPTRSPKQVRNHYKNYAEKVKRHMRGLNRGTSPLQIPADCKRVCYPANLNVASVSRDVGFSVSSSQEAQLNPSAHLADDDNDWPHLTGDDRDLEPLPGDFDEMPIWDHEFDALFTNSSAS